MNTNNLIRSTTAFAMHIIRPYAPSGSVLIDATCGNGHDTLQLARLDPDRLFAFDVQEKAIAATKDQLLQNGYESALESGRFTVTRLLTHRRAIIPCPPPASPRSFSSIWAIFPAVTNSSRPRRHQRWRRSASPWIFSPKTASSASPCTAAIRKAKKKKLPSWILLRVWTPAPGTSAIFRC